MQEKDEALPPHQDKSNPNIKSTEKNLKERQVGGEDEGRATSPSNVRGSPKSPTSKHVETREEGLNQHRGSREMREMTVETIMFTGLFICLFCLFVCLFIHLFYFHSYIHALLCKSKVASSGN